MLPIAIDVMSGDNEPREYVAGALRALAEDAELRATLVGDPALIEAALPPRPQRCVLAPPSLAATEVVDHGREASRGHPSEEEFLDAGRDRPGARGPAGACVSAGNTGALTAIAHFVLKTLPGVERAAIISAIPAAHGLTLMLDLGANTKATPEQLRQFAAMGAIISRDVYGRASPRIGLLNIGEEDIKGHEVVQAAHALLGASGLNYVGFVEGDDIFSGDVDVVVTDGFTGNVALKTMEGVAGLIADRLRQEFQASFLDRLAGSIARPVLRRAAAGTRSAALQRRLHGRARRRRGKKPRSRRRCRLRARHRHRLAGGAPRTHGTHRTGARRAGAPLIYSRITGTGSHLPEKVLTNFDLEKMVDTTDEWIRTRTGIERRHIAADGETTVDLAESPHAARSRRRASRPEDVDFIAFGTTTPDLVFPNCGTLLQGRLGCRGVPAFSVETACAGFMYALSIADKYVRCGEAKRALVVGAETLSRITDWSDRSTAVLFADGAGAVVLDPGDEPGMHSTHLHSDGHYKDLLYCASGVSKGLAPQARDHDGRERGVQGGGHHARAGGR